MDRAATYARVSTEEQALHGISLDAQVHRCTGYVAGLGYELIDTAVDAGISAKTIEGPGLQRILFLVNKKKIEHIVTLKLDRLSRSTLDALSLVDSFSKKGVLLHLVAENGSVNSDNADDEFLLTLKAGLAQLERKKIAERTKSALDHKRQRGERISLHPAYGYKFTGSKVEANTEEQSIIARIHDLHAHGLSVRAIVRELALEGVHNRKNKQFAIPSIQRIIKRQVSPRA